jgi:ComF family protein
MLFNDFKEGLLGILFPDVCTVCGLKLASNENFVCNRCLNEKFETANLEFKISSSDIMLPEGVDLQHALWNFDKGGELQELLHQLKYHRLTGVGEDIGRQLGKSLLQDPLFMQAINKQKVRLIPVPLHPKKRRLRGYNQAFFIAKGVAEATGLHILDKEAVVRIRDTGTQTGFSTERRRENIRGAFEVKIPDAIKDTICVIIDDVFTTGATTFEMASVLTENGSAKILIATVAQA